MGRQVFSLSEQAQELIETLNRYLDMLHYSRGRAEKTPVALDNALMKINSALMQLIEARPAKRKKRGRGRSGGTTLMETSPDQRKGYDLAYKYYEEKNYKSAIPLFQDFVKQYPKSELTPLALYYEGESYYLDRFYVEGIECLERADMDFPGTNGGNLAKDKLAEIRRDARDVIRQAVNYHLRDVRFCLDDSFNIVPAGSKFQEHRIWALSAFLMRDLEKAPRLRRCEHIRGTKRCPYLFWAKTRNNRRFCDDPICKKELTREKVQAHRLTKTKK